MQPETNGILATIKNILGEIDPSMVTALVTAKKSVKSKGTTTNFMVFMECFENLRTPSNGLRSEGLELAIKHLENNGVTLLTMDASP